MVTFLMSMYMSRYTLHNVELFSYLLLQVYRVLIIADVIVVFIVAFVIIMKVCIHAALCIVDETQRVFSLVNTTRIY